MAEKRRRGGQRIYPSKHPFIEHGGIRYYRDAQGWRASACKGGRRLHTVLWEDAHGPVPRGHHLFCTDPEHPSLGNIELRAAYAGMADYRDRLSSAAERQWQARRDELEALANAGLTRAQMAPLVGASKGALVKWCRHLGLKGQRPGPRPHLKRDELITEMHLAGARQIDIAEKIGVSQARVGAIIKRLDLPRWPRCKRRNLQPDGARP